MPDFSEFRQDIGFLPKGTIYTFFESGDSFNGHRYFMSFSGDSFNRRGYFM